ncbi:hypothetical protein E2C01_010038 [Portunus trituberculatus]|uniref:CCHC-type domain-containing protein n=1 Tax=Portunus trituberculatus TaxID=210409 RepID=A0A5B7D7C5_PORTR|nr:hypothetical protein [Portunus trituberculatus]
MVTFKPATMTTEVIAVGRKLFHMRIPSHQIHQEKFYYNKTCLCCYKIEDQYFKAYLQNSNCFEFGEIGHIWKECNKVDKRCQNCEGNQIKAARKALVGNTTKKIDWQHHHLHNAVCRPVSLKAFLHSDIFTTE